MTILHTYLNNSTILLGWFGLVFFSLSVVLAHIRHDNAEIPWSAKCIWTVITIFTGPLGMALYWMLGRAHQRYTPGNVTLDTYYTYAGCGVGLMVGSILAVLLVTYTDLALLNTYQFTIVSMLLFFTTTIGGIGAKVVYLEEKGIAPGHLFQAVMHSGIVTIVLISIVLTVTEVLLFDHTSITDPLFWAALSASLLIGLSLIYTVALVQTFAHWVNSRIKSISSLY